MSNEILLILSLIIIYGMVLVLYKLFELEGLYMWTIIATIAANIEVLIYIKAFGMGMTLGNVLFASTFLVTDIISEIYGKKSANKAVKLGIITSVIFMLLSQFWLFYTPHPTQDTVMPSMKIIFSSMPRLMIASLVVYAVAQVFDVWCYHKWWSFTEKLTGDKRKFLWLRNNGSTLISQLINTVFYTMFAFAGTFSTEKLLITIASSYVIFIFTSLLDTPFVYIVRWINDKKVKIK
mgnify:CR=1 FL=1